MTTARGLTSWCGPRLQDEHDTPYHRDPTTPSAEWPDPQGLNPGNLLSDRLHDSPHACWHANRCLRYGCHSNSHHVVVLVLMPVASEIPFYQCCKDMWDAHTSIPKSLRCPFYRCSIPLHRLYTSNMGSVLGGCSLSHSVTLKGVRLK